MRVAYEADVGARSLSSLETGPVCSRAASRRPRASGTGARGEPSGLRRPRDEQSFQRAVSPHRALLCASALRLTKNRSDADDLVQDTLLRAWRYWPRYREQDNCRAWLQRIMLNTFCSERRSRARRRAVYESYGRSQRAAQDLAAADTGLCADPHRDVSHEALSSSLSALKPEHARILRLVDMDQRSYREAAAELACPVGTVMSRLHRARLALRTRLAAQVKACA